MLKGQGGVDHDHLHHLHPQVHEHYALPNRGGAEHMMHERHDWEAQHQALPHHGHIDH